MNVFVVVSGDVLLYDPLNALGVSYSLAAAAPVSTVFSPGELRVPLLVS